MYKTYEYKLLQIGYKIEEECFVLDKGKGYIIIKFIKGEGEYTREDLIYGPYLKSNKEYLTYLYNKIHEVFDKIPNDNPEKKLKQQLLHEVDRLIKELS